MEQKAILLVETDSCIAARTGDLLARLGYRVLEPVATAEAAIQAAATEQPDLILINAELAGPISGIETAHRIRQSSDVPIVHLTSCAQDPPLPEPELAARLEAALYSHKLHDEVEASRRALHESEERFRALFDSMAEAVVLHELITDPDRVPVNFRILSVNPAFERMSGRSAAECVGKLVTELTADGSVPYLKELAEVAISGVPVTFEASFPGRHLRISAVCPKPGTFATVILDITDSKRMEEALDRERRSYRELFDNSVDAIFVRDLEGHFIDVNRLACAWLGYSREELIGKRPIAIVPPEEASLVADRLARTLTSGGMQCEMTFLARDGRRLPGEIHTRLVEFDGGPAVLGVVRDITERKRAEAALRESDTFLRDVLDSGTDHVAVLDRNGIVVAVNRAWTKFAQENSPPGDPVFGPGTDYLRICEDAALRGGELSAAEAAAGIRQVLEGRRSRFSLEYPCHSPQERRWFLMTVTPLTGPKPGAVVAHTSITERRAAEESLREKTEELDRYFETALDLFCIADLDGYFRRVNHRWTALLGYTSAELERTRFFDFVHPDDLPATLETLGRLSQRIPVLNFVNRYRCRDGSWRWLEWQSYPADNLIFAAARDITDRKLAERALERSQAELRAIYESAPVMLCLIDQGGHVVSANDAFQAFISSATCDVSGPGALLGCINLMPEGAVCGQGGACKQCALRALLNESFRMRRAVSNVECRISVLHGGEPRDIMLLASTALVDTTGEPRLLLCLADISERHRAEAAVRRSEENYRNLIQRLPDGVVVHSGGKVLFYNEEAARLLGGSDVEAVGAEIDTYVSAESRELVRERCGALENGALSVPAVELKYTRRDGTTLEIEAASVAITYQGRPAIHTVFRDITARKLLEEQLRHAQKMESVGRLAGGVAHDFNNLLTVINGYSQLLLGGLNPEDPMHETLLEISRAGGRAAALTRQLLAFSRKQVMQPRLVNLNSVIGEMHSLLTRMAGDTTQLQIDLDPRPLVVHADPHQFEQVVMNLVVNARDAVPGGGVISIATSLEDRAPNSYAVVQVRDDGSGMDDDVRRRIFEPFFTTKEQGAGTGLGLAMVQGIVEQSGGFIEVDSEPGRGSAFRVYLPLATGAEAPELDPAPGRDVEGDETILLVEDQREVRLFCSAALTSFGYKVLHADGPAAALELCARKGALVDLVLSDVVMPEISGPALAAKIATLRPSLKVLFMSGHVGSELALHGVPNDPASLISKPFTPRELAARVRLALGPRRVRRRILVLDQESAIRKLLKALLGRAGFEVIEATTVAEGLEAARQYDIDLLVADVSESATGIAELKLLRNALPGAGVLAMSAASPGSNLERIRGLGISAFLSKPIGPEDLIAAVKSSLPPDRPA